MDKSESEILEEWTLVSSVDDTEQGNATEKKINANIESDANGEIQASINDSSEINTNSNSEINTETNNDSGTESRIDLPHPDTEEPIIVNASTSVDIKKTDGDIDSVEADTKVTAESNAEETIETDSNETHELNTKEAIQADIEESVEIDSEEGAEADTEETSEPDTEEITVIETIMYDVKKISDIDTEKATEASVDKASYADIDEVKNENEKTDIVEIKTDDDIEGKECLDSVIDVNTIAAANIETDIDLKTDYSGDQIVNSSLDSSMEHIQIEHYDGSSVQNLPELIPNLTEQESAAIESSSSDIDIIDENMEESISSSFLHPLSLSIQASVDTSGILTSPSDDVKIEDVKQLEKSEFSSGVSETCPKISEAYAEKIESKILETFPKRSDYEYQRQSYEERRESTHHRESQRPRPDFNIVSMILHFLRNMSCLEWSLIGGIIVGLYLTVVYNQINIFAVIEKDNVVSQMKEMIDELKYDNKILKDQMLSEMKNDKMFSSFEHQIKELRKENSRLNHMLYDVAKVLEKQKDSHEKYEKKEAENLAPFKKEINKLKEHINILKFDNEELQKQLVRMRYASYSQGGTDKSEEKGKEQKKETESDASSSTDEIPLDINSLKKWNELISLLGKELRILQENDPLAGEKYYSETKQNINWYWKAFLKGFKGTYEEFKANITSKFSDYKKVHENTLSDIYKSVKNFFTVEEQNNQRFTPSDEKDSQWKNIGDFFSDLKDKWTKIKSRIDTSDLKSFFKDFKMPGDSDTSQEYNPRKTYEYKEEKPTNVHFESEKKSTNFHFESEKKPTNVHFESERKPTNIHFESERRPTNVHFDSVKKQDKVQRDSEDSKWMFERAALRAELRDAETEEDVNWFLKKNKRSSRDNEKK